MINYKLKYNLKGPENWCDFPSVFVAGVPNEENTSVNKSEEENETIIQSWKNIAVLRVTSEHPAQFYIGFYNKAVISYLKHEFETNCDLGVRIGPGDVNFFVFPRNREDSLTLECIERTTEDDSKYSALNLI